MARALTRVSRDYNWTIKRAGNDLHDAINPRLQLSSPSSHDIRFVDLSVFPWDVSVRFTVGEGEGHV